MSDNQITERSETLKPARFTTSLTLRNLLSAAADDLDAASIDGESAPVVIRCDSFSAHRIVIGYEVKDGIIVLKTEQL